MKIRNIMCLWVERAHLRELAARVEKAIDEIRQEVELRSVEYLLQLPSRIAEPAIIFRDFPKKHGNIIQRAVGIALANHVGGYTRTSARFRFLSGLSVEVDNFFMASNGQIYLFETKRDHSQIREEGVAGRKLASVKNRIENELAGRHVRLKHPIQICYFSYFDGTFGGAPKANKVDIGSTAAPNEIDMPVYSREDMNKLIGPCFGRYLRSVDRLIGEVITANVPDLAIVSQRAEMRADDVNVDLAHVIQPTGGNEFIKFGDAPQAPSVTEEQVLA
jgi:hypothetical protein